MFTDSHCHLHYLKERNPAELITAMKTANVHRAMLIMCNFAEQDAIDKWLSHSDDTLSLGASVGIHPCQDSALLADISVEKLLAKSGEKTWAYGETGLDYYWDDSSKLAQQHSFITHIQAGRINHKPIVVHTRSAYHDTLAILKNERCEHGIIHCFTEDYAFAKQALDMGLYISFSGIISFKKSTALQDVAKKLPLDRLLIETDSPYLAPVPKRGKDNEPAFVPFVAQALGTLFNKSAENIGAITDANFSRLLQQYAN